MPTLARRIALGVGLVPFAALCVGVLRDSLGANPVEEITHTTGESTLRFLLVSLSVTPLRRLSGWSWLAPLRRTFGLLAFFYACLHLTTYVVFDHFFDWLAIVEDVVERRYITAGFAGFLLMIPLAVTSTRAMMKRLGRSWTRLHRLVYLAAALGVLHHLWLAKADLRSPRVHAAVLALLLGYRAAVWIRRGRPRRVAE